LRVLHDRREHATHPPQLVPTSGRHHTIYALKKRPAPFYHTKSMFIAGRSVILALVYRVSRGFFWVQNTRVPNGKRFLRQAPNYQFSKRSHKVRVSASSLYSSRVYRPIEAHVSTMQHSCSHSKEPSKHVSWGAKQLQLGPRRGKDKRRRIARDERGVNKKSAASRSERGRRRPFPQPFGPFLLFSGMPAVRPASACRFAWAFAWDFACVLEALKLTPCRPSISWLSRSLVFCPKRGADAQVR
jgi:hypothetical protein